MFGDISMALVSATANTQTMMRSETMAFDSSINSGVYVQMSSVGSHCVWLSTASHRNTRARSRMNAPSGLGSMHESYVRVEPTWDKT